MSEDGSVIRSEPGMGVVKAGWHCGGNSAGIGNFFKIRPDGSDRTPLTFFDPVGPQTFGPARAWSPDAATLVAPGNVDGVKTLFTIARLTERLFGGTGLLGGLRFVKLLSRRGGIRAVGRSSY